MIRNYFKIAVRNFIKERFYALINVTGLAIGIASSLLLILYILHERVTILPILIQRGYTV